MPGTLHVHVLFHFSYRGVIYINYLEHFSCSHSFNPHNPVRCVLLADSFYIEENTEAWTG